MNTAATVSSGRTRTLGMRAWWCAVSVPAFTVAWATAQALGEVVGEAWGGEFLHQLGHAIGTVLLVGSLSLAGWLALRGRVAWAGRWAVAGTVGSIAGLVLYVPILAMAPPAIVGLTIALTFYLPLVAAAVCQTWSVRGHIPAPRRWVAAWVFAVLVGVAAAWYAGGGVEGAAGRILVPGVRQGRRLLVAHDPAELARRPGVRSMDGVGGATRPCQPTRDRLTAQPTPHGGIR